MRYRKSMLYALLLVGVVSFVSACSPLRPVPTPQPEWQDTPHVAAFFEKAGVQGTFVLYKPQTDTLEGFNFGRARTRFIPASTFKILNSLIAFETGVVRDTAQILPYGGQPQTVKAWERDMTIKEAIAVSNVPLYQGIARNIGLERMHTFVQRVAYGNADVGDRVDTFWLEGPLAISALEQIMFIRAVLDRRLPFSSRSFDLLQEIMPQESTADGQGRIFFKTGTAQRTRTGWVVGWLDKQGVQYPFALNIDMERPQDGALRLSLMRDALQVVTLP